MNSTLSEIIDATVETASSNRVSNASLLIDNKKSVPSMKRTNTTTILLAGTVSATNGIHPMSMMTAPSQMTRCGSALFVKIGTIADTWEPQNFQPNSTR